MNRTISKKNIKRVAVIHDIVSFGKAGMMNIIPILSYMGIEVCPIPTSILSTHTAYNNVVKRQLNGYIKDAFNHYKCLNIKFDAILIGYIGNEEIVDEVIEVISDDNLKDVRIIFDPVFADNDKLYKYITYEYIEKLKGIIKYSDLILPNYTEAKYLTGSSDINTIMDKLSDYGVKCSVVTGITDNDEITIFSGINKKVREHKFKRYNKNFHGTGDIFSAIMTGYYLDSIDIDKAITLAHEFIYECIKYSSLFNYDEKEGIIIENNLIKLWRQDG